MQQADLMIHLFQTGLHQVTTFRSILIFPRQQVALSFFFIDFCLQRFHPILETITNRKVVLSPAFIVVRRLEFPPAEQIIFVKLRLANGGRQATHELGTTISQRFAIKPNAVHPAIERVFAVSVTQFIQEFHTTISSRFVIDPRFVDLGVELVKLLVVVLNRLIVAPRCGELGVEVVEPFNFGIILHLG